MFIYFFALIAGSSALRAQQPAVVGTDAAEIIELLNKYRPDPAKVAELRREIAAEPPANLQGIELARFLIRRSEAAEQLGAPDRIIGDLEHAFQLMETNGITPRSDQALWFDIVGRLTNWNLMSGNFSAAKTFATRSASAAGSTANRGRMIQTNMQLAMIAFRVGDVESTRAHVRSID